MHQRFEIPGSQVVTGAARIQGAGKVLLAYRCPSHEDRVFLQLGGHNGVKADDLSKCGHTSVGAACHAEGYLLIQCTPQGILKCSDDRAELCPILSSPILLHARPEYLRDCQNASKAGVDAWVRLRQFLPTRSDCVFYFGAHGGL